MVNNITDSERKHRALLVKRYNSARTLNTKKKRYDELMVFEEYLFGKGHNG